MSGRAIRTLAVVACLAMAGTAFANGKGKGKKDDNQRRDWYKQYDFNDNGRWGCKANKKFKKDHRKIWDNLNDWCEKAKEKPKKYDVKFPKGEKEKKSKCKKGRKDAAYMKAWVKDGKKKDKKGKDKDEIDGRTRTRQ